MKKRVGKPKVKRIAAKRAPQVKTAANGTTQPLEKQLRNAYARRACGQPTM